MHKRAPRRGVLSASVGAAKSWLRFAHLSPPSDAGLYVFRQEEKAKSEERRAARYRCFAAVRRPRIRFVALVGAPALVASLPLRPYGTVNGARRRSAGHAPSRQQAKFMLRDTRRHIPRYGAVSSRRDISWWRQEAAGT